MKGSVRPLLRNGQKQYSKKTRQPIWRIVYDVGKPGARRKQKTKCFTGTRKEADDELRQLLNKAHNTKIVNTDLTVAEFLQKWWQWKRGRVTPKVHARYGQIIAHNIGPVLGKTKLQALTLIHIEDAWDILLESGHRYGGGLSPKSVRNIHGVLSSALKWGLKRKYIQDLPTLGVELPTYRGKRPDVLNAKESEQLIESLDGHWLQPIVIIALDTGMRLGEILALHWRHLGWAEKRLTIEQSVSYTKELGAFIKETKTTSGERTIDLTQRTLNLFEELQRKRRELVMQLPDSRDLGKNDAPIFDRMHCGSGDFLELTFGDLVGEHFRRHAKKVGIKIRFHDLRHTHISQCLKNKLPISYVSKRVGHKSIKMTLDTYSHWIDDDGDNMMAVFDKQHSENKTPKIRDTFCDTF